MPKLTSKTALVTGAQVLVHCGRGTDEAKAVVAEIHEAGGRDHAIAADLAAPDGLLVSSLAARGVVGTSGVIAGTAACSYGLRCVITSYVGRLQAPPVRRPIPDRIPAGAFVFLVSIPRQSRGLYNLGRSKRRWGSLTRPRFVGAT